MTTPRRPPGRYDEPRTLPRPVLVGGAVVGGLLLVLGAYLAYDRFAADGVTWGTVGYEVVDDASARVTFEVVKGVTASADCLLQARDRDNAVVASEKVRVGPSDRERVRVTRTLETSRRATTAELVRCALVTS